MLARAFALWRVIVPYLVILAGVCVTGGITVPFIYRVSEDRRKRREAQSDMEGQLLNDLPEVNAVQNEMWVSIPSAQHDKIVEFYVNRAITRGRADLVLDFWNKAGRMYQEKRVDRRRFLPRIAPACNATWNHFGELLKYFAYTQPARIEDFKRLQKTVGRYVEKTRRRMDRDALRVKSREGQ